MNTTKLPFRSIGWLHQAGGGIVLTPVRHGASHPLRVVISAEVFEGVRQNKEQMMAKAAEMLGMSTGGSAVVAGA